MPRKSSQQFTAIIPVHVTFREGVSYSEVMEYIKAVSVGLEQRAASIAQVQDGDTVHTPFATAVTGKAIIQKKVVY